MWMVFKGAPVYNSLPIIFTGGLQIIQFEQTVSCRVKVDSPCFFGELSVFNQNSAIFDQAWIEKSSLFGDRKKVIPVKRTAQTFASDLGILQSA